MLQYIHENHLKHSTTEKQQQSQQISDVVPMDARSAYWPLNMKRSTAICCAEQSKASFL